MRLKLIIAALVFSAAVAPMETVAASKATQIAQAAPTPKPTPNAFVWSGYFRGYDFTRQNASNNVGEQYSPAKYNYNAVNQQTFEAGLSKSAARISSPTHSTTATSSSIRRRACRASRTFRRIRIPTGRCRVISSRRSTKPMLRTTTTGSTRKSATK
jgi:hypothetical protein